MATRGAAAHPTQDASRDIQSLSEACITSGTEGKGASSGSFTREKAVQVAQTNTFGGARRWGRHKVGSSSTMRPVSGPVRQSTARQALSETHTHTHGAGARCNVRGQSRGVLAGHKVKVCGEHRERS